MKRDRAALVVLGALAAAACLAEAYVVPGSFPVDYALGDDLEGEWVSLSPRPSASDPCSDNRSPCFSLGTRQFT